MTKNAYSRRRVIVSRWNKSQARIAWAWAHRNSAHDGPARRGEGSMSALCRMVQTVEAPIWWPSPASSPWMRRYPHVGFFGGQAHDQGPQASGDGRSTGPGGPGGPAVGDELAVPAQDGGRG